MNTLKKVTVTNCDGKQQTVKVGDWIDFKNASDFERRAQVTRITQQRCWDDSFETTFEVNDGNGWRGFTTNDRIWK